MIPIACLPTPSALTTLGLLRSQARADGGRSGAKIFGAMSSEYAKVACGRQGLRNVSLKRRAMTRRQLVFLGIPAAPQFTSRAAPPADAAMPYANAGMMSDTGARTKGGPMIADAHAAANAPTNGGIAAPAIPTHSSASA
jgi:hypothetical protein